MVRRDHKRRLRAVELACPKPAFQIWITQGDGTVRGPHGEQMTREEAEALERAAGRFAFIISSVDARL
jgi:hypothetical protein